jgi:hypothetical protein
VRSKDRELVTRLTAVSRNLEMLNQHLGELLQRGGDRYECRGLSVRDLRRVGHRLVSLSGDLTTLGVDAARWADDLEEATGMEHL